ncbi:hypothetical protein CKA32_001700 [Geitlerinema sp. FC II]|nr:hypothetical protein CKA32_001700 [Geitlerinema sp. FC II]
MTGLVHHGLSKSRVSRDRCHRRNSIEPSRSDGCNFHS